jgi:hypothetical protein
MTWKEWPAGRQGILGLPLLIALDALRWTRDDHCDTGESARHNVSARMARNLAYEGLHLIVTASHADQSLQFILDTGNQAGTQLWPRFGVDFASMLKAQGRPGTVRLTQLGSSVDREVTVLDELPLTVGGMRATLAPANVFARPVGDDQFHGLLGMDVLNRASEVTIDFESLVLRLR